MRKAGTKLAAVVAASLLLGGCGTAPYELTEQESSLISNYAAHIVMKYNLNQREGLQYVKIAKEDAAAEEDTGTQDAGTAETEQPSESAQETGGTGETGDQETAEGAGQATLQELFGNDTVTAEYNGYELTANNYVANTYYAMNADAGKQYLVLHIVVTNNGDTEQTVDNLSKDASFEVNYDGASAAAEFTVLPEDFSTYEGTVGAGEAVDTELFFQIPDSVTEVQNMTLYVSMDGNSYQIILDGNSYQTTLDGNSN